MLVYLLPRFSQARTLLKGRGYWIINIFNSKKDIRLEHETLKYDD